MKDQRETAHYPAYIQPKLFPLQQICSEIVDRFYRGTLHLAPELRKTSTDWETYKFQLRCPGQWSIEFGPVIRAPWDERRKVREILNIEIPHFALSFGKTVRDIRVLHCHTAALPQEAGQAVYVYQASEGGFADCLPIFVVAADDGWLAGNRPAHFLTRDVLAKFERFLREHVLDQVINPEDPHHVAGSGS